MMNRTIRQETARRGNERITDIHDKEHTLLR